MCGIFTSFFHKVDADYAAYLARWRDKPFSQVLPHAAEISHMVRLHRCLHRPGLSFQAGHIAYLNRFAHPLDILLAHREEYDYDDTKEILDNQLRAIFEERYADEKGCPLDTQTPCEG